MSNHDPLREALEAFLRVWEGGAVAPVNFLQGLAGVAEQARAALDAVGVPQEADPSAAPAPALDAIRSHAFGPCLVCGAQVDDPEAFETCAGPAAAYAAAAGEGEG